MSTADNPELLALAAEAAYADNSYTPNALIAEGYVPLEPIVDADTGFHAQVWENQSSNEYVVAIRGTNSTSAQDWYTNIQLGAPQYDSDGASALRDMVQTFNTDATVHFTGHSLGGALAQYFALETANENLEYEVTLTTFNGLGGSLYADHTPALSTADPSLIASATHYVTQNDAVARLGHGHVAGDVYMIDTGAVDPIEAHDIKQFTGSGPNTSPANFASASLLGAAQLADFYLDIDHAQSIAAAHGAVWDDASFNTLEAGGRLLLGLIPAVIEAPESELIGLEEAFLGHLPYAQSAHANGEYILVGLKAAWGYIIDKADAAGEGYFERRDQFQVGGVAA